MTTDQAADGIQNMNIQDYEGCEFDPFGPQQTKITNLQSNGGTDVDLIGNHSVDPDIPNGHNKLVSFDPGMNPGPPDSSYLGQGQGEGSEVQRHMSSGEILGFQNEYGESNITGQMEYEGYSDEEYGGNSRDYENGPPVLPDPQSDQDYYMSTGQPLVDFGSENVQSGGHLIGHGQPPMGDHQFEQQNTDDYSSQVYDNEYEDGYDNSDIRESDPAYQAEAYNMDDDCDNDETEPSSWAPEMDAERARRSLSPERSVSPRDITSQSGADVISSPQYDTDSFADTGDLISSPVETVQHPFQSDPHSFIPASDMIGSPGRALSPQPSVTESESSYADSKGSPRHKIPRPSARKKKPTDLPPWDDNVVIPPLPRMKPTMIGKQPELPPPSSPQRPRTAPSLFTRKDGSSDSGVEEDKTAMSPRKSTHESKLKRYGTDCKNQAYKPGGGNVAIFDEKVEVKVGSRTDTSRPKSAMSPRTSVSSDRSPSTPKPPTPNTRNVQSKIGSLNNVKHRPGGGDVAVLSSKVDFSTVRSKVGSKDKLDYKPKGGDKKIESQKLAWKAESKVGSLKNATHSPGGGNVKDGWTEVQGTMDTRENIHYIPGGGNIPGPYGEDLDWDSDARVNTLDNIDYMPGGGNVKIFSETLHWGADAKVDTNLPKKSKKLEDRTVNSEAQNCRTQEVTADIEKQPSQSNFADQLDRVEHSANISREPQIHDTNGRLIMKDGTDSESEIPLEKPPRCIHKQWETDLDRQRTLLTQDDPVPYANADVVLIANSTETQTSTDKDNLEVVYMTKEHLKNILSDFDETSDVTLIKKIDTDSKDSAKNSGSKVGLNSYQIDEGEMENDSVDHKKFVVELNETPSTLYSKVTKTKGKQKRKRSISRKIKDLFTSKNKAEDASIYVNKQKRFSSTSKEVNKKGGKGEDSNASSPEKVDDKTEVELMVKNLGFHSPKLLKKGNSDVNEDKTEKDKKVRKKTSQKNKKKVETKPVEKIANLGYESPELAKRKRDVLLTGSKNKSRSQRSSTFDPKALHTNLKSGITRDYQEVDFNMDANDTGCVNRIKTGLVESDGIVNRAFDKSLESDSSEEMSFDSDISDADREINFAYVALKGEGSKPKPIQTTTFKYKVNPEPASPCTLKQTQIDIGNDVTPEKTTEKQYNNEGILHGFHDGVGSMAMLDRVKQPKEKVPFGRSKCDGTKLNLPWKSYDYPNHAVLVDGDIHPHFSQWMTQSEERVDKLAGEIMALQITHKVETVDDTHHESSTLGKQRRGCSPLMQSTVEATCNADQHNINNDLDMFDEDEKENVFEPRIRKTVTNIAAQQRNNAHLKRKEELTFEDELKSVLAGIQANREDRFLKSPVSNAGSETGSQPGTPTIPVKPIRLQEDDHRNLLTYSRSLIGRRYGSSVNVPKVSTTAFERSSRSQSLMMKRTDGIIRSNLMSTRQWLNKDHAGCTSLHNDKILENTNEDTSQLMVEGRTIARDITDNQMVPNQRLSWSAQSRVGSLDNARHTPGGGKVKILDQKLEVKAQSKVGSTANLKHKPGGGDKKIEVQKLEFQENAKSKVGSMDKVKHRPGGGDVKVIDEKVSWNAESRIGSLDNVKHVPGGGVVHILDEKVDFSEKVNSKIGSLDKIKHQPGGGDVKIETQKLTFKETAKSRTNTGVGSEKEKSRSLSRTGSIGSSSQDDSIQG